MCWVVRKARKSSLCVVCCDALMDFCSPTGFNLLTEIRDFGPLYYPSADLVKLLRLCERLVRAHYSFPTLLTTVMQEYGREGALFGQYSDHFACSCFCLSTHYYSLIRFCVEAYFDLCMRRDVKEKNLARRRCVRHKLNKHILQMHE